MPMVVTFDRLLHDFDFFGGQTRGYDSRTAGLIIVATRTKLWPWPMQDRIVAANAYNDWDDADPMAELAALFLSPIPAACNNAISD